MSYNGIGLSTVRGSATSGYVSRNLSHVKPDFFRKKIENNTSGGKNQSNMSSSTVLPYEKKNEDIVEHNRKRALESQVYELEENLKEKGYSEREISRRVSDLRDQFNSNSRSDDNGRGRRGGSGGKGSVDSHTLSVAKENENRRIARAFGINRDDASPREEREGRRSRGDEAMHDSGVSRSYRDTDGRTSSSAAADRRHHRNRSRSRSRSRDRERGDKDKDRGRDRDRERNERERVSASEER